MLGDYHLNFAPAPRRLVACLWFALTLAPVVFVAVRIVATSRNVAYWDEFDTALSLVLQLDSGLGFNETVARLFAVSNEHRMVTSRLLFATSYWLTGTVNFTVICAIGNTFLLLLGALLLWRVGTLERRVRLAAPFAFLLFQLEHYENFLWSGSSIDHFQVVLLAAGVIAGVAHGSRLGLLTGMLLALLATFTLAHGLLAWPIGAAMLWRQRRRLPLVAWSALAAFVIAGFLTGFHLNHAQRFADPSLAGAGHVVRYWLSLLGAAPAFGHERLAPFLGVVLLGATVVLAVRGAPRREPVVFPLTAFAIGALALIAFGRALEAGGAVHSRYFVLSALAWALVLFMAVERSSHPRRPFAVALACLPALIAFNLAANRTFAPHAESWIESRDRAALRFKQHGHDGRGPFRLFPVPAHSTALLNEAERRGVYRMPPICERREFRHAMPSGRISYFVDELIADQRAAVIAGWAGIAGREAMRGQIHLVLRSARATYIFTTVTITRPDVAAVTRESGWTRSGFRFAMRRDRLPTGEFQIGFLIADGGKSEYVMTEHRLQLVGEGKALLATAD